VYGTGFAAEELPVGYAQRVTRTHPGIRHCVSGNMCLDGRIRGNYETGGLASIVVCCYGIAMSAMCFLDGMFRRGGRNTL
jgi:hypothetical protein